MPVADAINEEIFRAYDIRGIYPKDINENIAERVGRAFGAFIGPGKEVLLGRDVRLSGPKLSAQILKGMLSSGINVIEAGVIPTPLLYFTISHRGLAGGIMVSASHNPPEWNGFKMCKRDAYVIGEGGGIDEIKRMVEGVSQSANAAGKHVDKSAEIMKEYLSFLSGKVTLKKGINVGLDSGNGSYAGIARETFAAKGANVTAINDEPDGRFPNRSPEPNQSAMRGITELVKSKELEFGVAFDGDGDRCMFVTDKGTLIDNDIAIALIIKHFLVKGEKVAYEVSCSKIVEDMINERGGIPVLTKIGHSNFKEMMKSRGCRFGGETSGHTYFQEVYGADDGLFSALKMAELVSKTGKRLSTLVDEMTLENGRPKYVSGYVAFEAKDNAKFKIMEKILADLSKRGYKLITFDGVKAITPKGWFLLRASNTTPSIKCRAEAPDSESLNQIMGIAKEVFEKARASS